jgi:hypothetical protein
VHGTRCVAERNERRSRRERNGRCTAHARRGIWTGRWAGGQTRWCELGVDGCKQWLGFCGACAPVTHQASGLHSQHTNSGGSDSRRETKPLPPPAPPGAQNSAAEPSPYTIASCPADSHSAMRATAHSVGAATTDDGAAALLPGHCSCAAASGTTSCSVLRICVVMAVVLCAPLGA